MKSHTRIIPIFVPQDSCPYGCIFCNQTAVVGKKKPLSSQELKSYIHKCLQSLQLSSPEGKLPHIEIAYYGGSFTLLPRQLQEEYIRPASEVLKSGLIGGIRLSTRPDWIDNPILSFLRERGVSVIELGVQTMDDALLAYIRRGHTSEDVRRAMELLREFGFKTGIQLMIGLPGEDEASRNSSMAKVKSLKPDMVRIHPTLVIRDTPLEQLYLEGEYTPLSLEQAVTILKRLVLEFEAEGIRVIRLGLQPNRALEKPGTIVAGPYHPALGQLVASSIFYDLIKLGMERLQLETMNRLDIEVSPENISNMIGNKRENLARLKKNYPSCEIRVKGNISLHEDQMRLSVSDKLILIKKEELLSNM